MRNTLKILMAAAILTLPMMMNAQTVRSITFAVDEGLRPVEDREEAKQRYLERFGMAAKHGVVEYFCVEDTLCDYYMNQHEELKASRRRVSGVVLDENDEPLAHTMIYIWHEKRVWGFETTDSLGNFTFWVPRTDVKMEFTYVGFYKAVVVEPSDTFQTIYLLPNDNLKSLKESLKF